MTWSSQFSYLSCTIKTAPYLFLQVVYFPVCSVFLAKIFILLIGTNIGQLSSVMRVRFCDEIVQLRWSFLKNFHGSHEAFFSNFVGLQSDVIAGLFLEFQWNLQRSYNYWSSCLYIAVNDVRCRAILFRLSQVLEKLTCFYSCMHKQYHDVFIFTWYFYLVHTLNPT